MQKLSWSTPWRGSGRFFLTTLMIAASGLVLRWAVSPENPLHWYLLGGMMLALPVLVLSLLCWQQKQTAVRWGAGIGMALAAAYCHFILLDPQYNQDANIGLGLYMIGGFLLFLGPAALLGAALGWLLAPRLRKSP